MSPRPAPKANSTAAEGEGVPVSSVTFNSIVDILEAEFLLGGSVIRPEATLAELGLDSLASREFINAVEDAFRLCFPPRRLDARSGGMTLRALCELAQRVWVWCALHQQLNGRTPNV